MVGLVRNAGYGHCRDNCTTARGWLRLAGRAASVAGTRDAARGPIRRAPV